MAKMIAMIMGQDCEQTIGMCLDSVEGANEIIYLDGGSRDGTLFEVKRRVHEDNILYNEYNQTNPKMNGQQRNFYLSYLKKHHMGDWVLCLDADEVLEDFGIQKIKQIINQLDGGILSPRIHHFIDNLGWEDATRDVHFVLNRLFKITEDLSYLETEHTVLQGDAQKGTIDVHIWHLRECLGIFQSQRKHENNWKKSQIHSKEYLNWWHMSMLMGAYPKKQVYYGSIPFVIKKRFGI